MQKRARKEAEKREAGCATKDFLQKKLSAMKETRDELPLEKPLLKSILNTGGTSPVSSKMHTPSGSVHKVLNTLESPTVAQSQGGTGVPRVTVPSSSSQPPAKRRRTLAEGKMPSDSLKSTTVSTQDMLKTTETGGLNIIGQIEAISPNGQHPRQQNQLHAYLDLCHQLLQLRRLRMPRYCRAELHCLSRSTKSCGRCFLLRRKSVKRPRVSAPCWHWS